MFIEIISHIYCYRNIISKEKRQWSDFFNVLPNKHINKVAMTDCLYNLFFRYNFQIRTITINCHSTNENICGLSLK